MRFNLIEDNCKIVIESCVNEFVSGIYIFIYVYYEPISAQASKILK